MSNKNFGQFFSNKKVEEYYFSKKYGNKNDEIPIKNVNNDYLNIIYK